jgi:hypothetical protein
MSPLGGNRRHCVDSVRWIRGDPPHVRSVRVHQVNLFVPIAAAAKHNLPAVGRQFGKPVVAEFAFG